jgi:hypothetical protein
MEFEFLNDLGQVKVTFFSAWTYSSVAAKRNEGARVENVFR